MNSLDIYILIPIVFGFIIGIFRGMVKEIISLMVIFIGILFSRNLAPFISIWLMKWFKISETAVQPISIIIAFLLIAIVLIIIGKIVHKMVKALSLGSINAFIGGIISTIKYALIVSVLLVLLEALDNQFAFLDENLKSESALYKPVKNFAPDLWKGFTKNID